MVITVPKGNCFHKDPETRPAPVGINFTSTTLCAPCAEEALLGHVAAAGHRDVTRDTEVPPLSLTLRARLE